MSRPHSCELLFDLLDLQGKRVVDVGCGNGALVRLMAGRGAHVLGVEASERQITKATAVKPVADEIYTEGLAEDLPVADGSIDVVVFCNSLHHVGAGCLNPGSMGEMETALAEAARVLKSGGFLYVSEPIADGPFFDLCRLVDDETEVRACAHAALRAASRFGLVEEREIITVNTVQLRDYEAFREKIVSANQEREPVLARMDTQMREAFQRLSTPGPDGFTFDQPTRTNVLARRR